MQPVPRTLSYAKENYLLGKDAVKREECRVKRRTAKISSPIAGAVTSL